MTRLPTRDERDALLQPHQQQEQRDPEPRRERWAPITGEHGGEGAIHAVGWIVVEEQIAELGRIEADDEPAERTVPRALPPLEGPKAPRREIVRGEAGLDRLARLHAGFERDRDAGREDRI